MIAPAAAEALAPFRRTYAEQPLPHVDVPALVSPALAARVRASLTHTPFEPFDFAPRGRYERSAAPPDPQLAAALTDIASFLAGAPLAILEATWLRARHRSYALLRDDAPRTGTLAELVLDVSERATSEGQLIYTHRGQPFFVANQAPGAVALVARGPTVQRYLRYVTHRAGDAELLRLVLSLGPA
ncbi:MAG: hypothetical protein R3B70_42915 [Polyangiaceae bacterium]